MAVARNRDQDDDTRSDDRSPAPSKVVKVSLNLPRELLLAVQRMADERHVTMTEVIRSSIETEDFIRSRVRDDKARVLLVDPDGEAKEIVFSRF